MVLNRYLLDRLCSCLFLCGSDHALEEAFLFLRSGFGLAVQSLDIQYIDTADNGPIHKNEQKLVNYKREL